MRGEAVTAPAAPSPAPTKTPRAFELSYKQYRSLRRRIDALEGVHRCPLTKRERRCARVKKKVRNKVDRRGVHRCPL